MFPLLQAHAPVRVITVTIRVLFIAAGSGAQYAIVSHVDIDDAPTRVLFSATVGACTSIYTQSMVGIVYSMYL